MAGPYPPEYGAGPVSPQIYPDRIPTNGAIGISGHAAAAGAISEETPLARLSPVRCWRSRWWPPLVAAIALAAGDDKRRAPAR